MWEHSLRERLDNCEPTTAPSIAVENITLPTNALHTISISLQTVSMNRILRH